MEELSVKVTQTPGVIAWNFEELKENLKEQLQVYSGLVYTDATIGTAKTDIAMLRKLATSVEDRRKEIKNKCLEPYALIEAQAKELVSLINEPINTINKQVAEYETRRKELVREEINSYWNIKAAELPENLREKAYTRIYDSRWENATATKKAYRIGIDEGIAAILKDLETIKSLKSEFEVDMLEVYSSSLQLSDSITKMNALQTMKRLVEERQRREEEARRAELERKATVVDVQPASNDEVPSVVAPATTEQPEIVENQNIIKGDTYDPFTVAADDSISLQITGTPEQLRKIKAFINYVGATYKEA